jgi:hypothetical protein
MASSWATYPFVHLLVPWLAREPGRCLRFQGDELFVSMPSSVIHVFVQSVDSSGIPLFKGHVLEIGETIKQVKGSEAAGYTLTAVLRHAGMHFGFCPAAGTTWEQEYVELISCVVKSFGAQQSNTPLAALFLFDISRGEGRRARALPWNAGPGAGPGAGDEHVGNRLQRQLRNPEGCYWVKVYFMPLGDSVGNSSTVGVWVSPTCTVKALRDRLPSMPQFALLLQCCPDHHPHPHPHPHPHGPHKPLVLFSMRNLQKGTEYWYLRDDAVVLDATWDSETISYDLGVDFVPVHLPTPAPFAELATTGVAVDDSGRDKLRGWTAYTVVPPKPERSSKSGRSEARGASAAAADSGPATWPGSVRSTRQAKALRTHAGDGPSSAAPDLDGTPSVANAEADAPASADLRQKAFPAASSMEPSAPPMVGLPGPPPRPPPSAPGPRSSAMSLPQHFPGPPPRPPPSAAGLDAGGPSASGGPSAMSPLPPSPPPLPLPPSSILARPAAPRHDVDIDLTFSTEEDDKGSSSTLTTPDSL